MLDDYPTILGCRCHGLLVQAQCESNFRTIVGLLVARRGLANSLAFATIVMTVLNLFTLWDVGFQLSVAATLGLILYSELFQEATRRLLERKLSTDRAKQVVGWISEALLLTLAAQITTTPLILKYLAAVTGHAAHQRADLADTGVHHH